ncbi:ankyrin repeat domain-containing protein [Candidatus Kirkpatrickella diaphorinae]|uniref:Ankyrin repeat domain-containing protein n=1 Tax=Candidatus Kirkpatrickella diaphorinae TaxID=2984322 RepID=A0ABY6GIZ9_9PROT|nr:ankyrin repeat domain-containing protein [Candidatus Kirkpatrickella diaphorinae]UYH51497.1 ankyrin repeat domain-containing protein [Candidatus Kirkpatrickella diaphorinae]
MSANRPAFPLSPLPRLLLIAILGLSAWVTLPATSVFGQTADEAEAEQEAAEAQKAAEARRAAKAAAPPSALPGADTQEQDAGHANRDLNPTDALYDAVNRGSLNAAKEALGRGANIYARNILDQTPLDLAIDLNRKDIIFLLLSMRGSDSTGRLANFDDDVTDANAAKGHRLSIKAEMRQKTKPVHQYDMSGGQAAPEIGFLGFGSK